MAQASGFVAALLAASIVGGSAFAQQRVPMCRTSSILGNWTLFAENYLDADGEHTLRCDFRVNEARRMAGACLLPDRSFVIHDGILGSGRSCEISGWMIEQEPRSDQPLDGSRQHIDGRMVPGDPTVFGVGTMESDAYESNPPRTVATFVKNPPQPPVSVGLASLRTRAERELDFCDRNADYCALACETAGLLCVR